MKGDRGKEGGRDICPKCPMLDPPMELANEWGASATLAIGESHKSTKNTFEL